MNHSIKKLLSICISLSLFILLLLNFSTYTSASTKDTTEIKATSDGFYYSISNNEVTIVEYTGKLSTLNIPNTIDGYPVTTIAYDAFPNNPELTEINIPPNISYIYNFAVLITTGYFEYYRSFSGCSNLININVDENNQYYSSINGILFSKDKSELIFYPPGKTETTYKIPYGVNQIGNISIWNSYITNLFLSDTVTSISLFGIMCPSAVVTLPDSLDYLGFHSIRCAALRGRPGSPYISGIPFITITNITFNPNNNSDIISKTTDSSQPFNYIPEIPSKDGYTFIGWFDKRGNKYINNSTYFEDTEFIAEYIKNISISFNNYDGSVLSRKDILENEPLDYIPESPDRAGYSFIGWFDNNGVEYINNSYYIQNTTFTAKYAKNINISFTDYDKSILSEYTVLENEPLNYIPESPCRDGYKFIGWFDNNNNEYIDGATYTEDTTFTATYEEIRSEELIWNGNSDLIEAGTYIVNSDLYLDKNYTIDSKVILIINDNCNIIIKNKINNSGTIINNGIIEGQIEVKNNGTIENNSSISKITMKNSSIVNNNGHIDTLILKDGTINNNSSITNLTHNTKKGIINNNGTINAEK